MADPRVIRTRRRVVDAVRELLAAGELGSLSFSSVAEASGVSRKTLYAHWGSVAALVGEVMADTHAEPTTASGLGARETLRAFLIDVRDGLAEPTTHAAVAYLVQAAVHDDDAAGTLQSFAAFRRSQLSTLLGEPVSETRFASIVGPVFFAQLLTGIPADDDLIHAIVTQFAWDPQCHKRY